MSENNGAHGESGATDDIDNTTGAGNAPNGAGSAASGAASTDASLESRAKAAKQGFNWWVVAVIAIVAVVAVVLGVTLFKPKSDAGGNAAADSGSSAGTVTIGLKLAPTNLDIRNQSGSSLDQVLIGNVYEGLVARDSDNQVLPHSQAALQSPVYVCALPHRRLSYFHLLHRINYPVLPLFLHRKSLISHQ